MTTGQAIFAVGITTAAAFFILLLADFKGFSEFGLIAGIGLLFAIATYILFLPALLVLLERSPLLDLKRITPKVAKTEKNIKAPYDRWTKLSLGIVGVGILVTFISLLKLPDLEFEYNFGELEPTYEEYKELNSLVSKVYSDRRTRNAAYIIVDDPSEASQVAEVIRQRKAADKESPTIRDVETFQDRYPFTENETQRKLERLSEIRELLNDPFLEGAEADDIERLRMAASPQSAIPVDSIPDFLKAPFTSATGTIGNLVIIHPSVGLSDGKNSMAFADDVGRVEIPNGKVYHAGSTSIVASDMLRLMMAEAPVMLVLTIIFIIVLKLLILHKIKWMMLALLPLAASFIWLFGMMDTIGWKLNFYNLVVLPTILGIGDDSGIHLVHRYLEEGKGSVNKVLRSTGEHITVSAFTTMLGFSGLLFSIHPGMRSIGEIAILGIGLSLLAAMILLPALLKMLEDKEEIVEEPILKS